MSGAAASSLREAALADLDKLKRQHPGAFRIVNRRGVTGLVIVFLALALLGFGLWRFGLGPGLLFSGLGQLAWFLRLMLPPDPGSWSTLLSTLNGLGETLAIAFLGTGFAALLALPISLLAASNTTVNGIARFLTRRSLDTLRGVNALIWALIWIGVVGLGPFAGVLAIITIDVGTLGKMFSEAIEAADGRAAEGITATGGNALHRIRFATLPEVMPVLAGQALYVFESNVRASTIIGIIGAGGIGLQLSEMIRTLEWRAVSFIILLILVMVVLIDWLSARLRRAIAGEARGEAG